MPTETISLLAETPEELMFTASTLAKSLYGTQTNVLLTGELGAGKTTFVKGLAKGLGLNADDIVSPTFTLEQRYPLSEDGTLLHLDLYRLSEKDAAPLLASGDELPGIRCIEWPEKAPTATAALEHVLNVNLQEEAGGRRLLLTCNDVRVPDFAQIRIWREAMKLPEHIVRHCDAVANLCGEIADALRRRGVLVRLELLLAAARTHDLLRFVDFRDGAAPDFPPPPTETLTVWRSWKEKYASLSHEEAVAQFFRQQGFDALATVVETHGVRKFSQLRTVEQKILYYADKRTMGEHVVSLDERFADFAVRYAHGSLTEEHKQWLAEAKSVERELL